MNIKKIYTTILDVLFPPQCVACHIKIEHSSRFTSICNECLGSIELHYGFFCPRCMRRIPGTLNTCHRECHYVLGATGEYKNTALRELIHALKYQNIKSAKEPLAYLLEHYLKIVLPFLHEHIVIVPMPLHTKKERMRGFNQSRLIAETLQKQSMWNIAIETNCLFKIKNTHSQTEYNNYEAREENVKNSFLVKHPELLKEKTVILLDDVFTSGATMNEAANTLRAHGIKNIISVVLAKA